ncbi:MAG: hypothetical protein ACJ72E_03290 [Marmoricola sp.]
MTPSRTALAAASALAATALLAGCGSDDVSSAHTTACRTYLLKAQPSGEASAQLVHYANGEVAGEDVAAELAAIRAAATTAGLTTNLPDKDFNRYRVLSQAADALTTKVIASEAGSEGSTVGVTASAPVVSAMKSIESSCG